MQTNFKLIGGFGIAEKEIKKRQVEINNIIDRYYEVGIREFFIGYNPPYWHERFGFELSPNGRFGENEQITSYETFKEAVNYVHSLKTEDGSPCEIFLTVNFRYYSDVTFPYVKQIINEALEAGVDGLIVGAPEILEYLAEIGFKGRINISTILSIYNSDAIEFFIDYFKNKGLNLNRVILPRELTLKEIEYISKRFPEIEFEAFGQGDYCRYANGLCLAEHKYFSRDLCGFVLKHGLEFKKALKYDFKKVITDTSLNDFQKQDSLNNEIDNIDYIFVTQNVVESNGKNTTISDYINLFLSNFGGELTDEEIEIKASKIYSLMGKEFTLNFSKFIYDGLRPSNDPYNQFITNTLTIHMLISPYIKEKNDRLENNIIKIKNIKEHAMKYFKQQKEEKGEFGIETYYKFMLYNRTSIPFYKFFNDLSNLKVLKIPLRGRDLTVFKLGINLIDDATQHPENYIDEGSLSGKYFHYDPSKLEIYKEKLEETEK